jgi:hypothetical protein
MLIRQVEEPLGRHVIGANRIDADGSHGGEIVGHAIVRGKRLLPAIQGKGPIGDALDLQRPPFPGEALSV